MVKVKVCGITNLEDACAAIQLGADAIGFVFAKSPRQVTAQQASRIIEKLPPFVSFTGLFVNAERKIVEKTIKTCRIDTLQFHGEESDGYCSYFKRTHKVVKAFKIKDKKSLDLLLDYDVDGYLLDTYIEGAAGGTGKVFDWNLAKKAKTFVNPIILSGGLNPGNVAQAIKKVRPYAVDVSSGIEKKPGKKDLRLMKEFIKAVRDA